MSPDIPVWFAPRNRFVIAIMVAFLTLPISNSKSEERALGFHGKSPTADADFSSCEITSHPLFEEVVAILKTEVAHKEYRPLLRVCKSGSFRAETIRKPQIGWVFYVNVPDLEVFDDKSLAATLAHEIYHTFQYFRFGYPKEVIDHYGGTIRTVELVADFGAGYLLSKTTLPSSYEMNPQLVGDFHPTQYNHHGIPSRANRSIPTRLFFHTSYIR